MKIIHIETLIRRGSIAEQSEWLQIRSKVLALIKEVDWLPGSGKFIIYPESGKKTGQGNGVKPIKERLMGQLSADGWKTECPLDIATVKNPGAVDAVFHSSFGLIALEWETGNISSSHRALNKLSLGLLKGKIAVGMLVVPSRQLYQYLTDRIGNYEELVPYLDLWRSVSCQSGVLEIVVIEHDGVSTDVPRIPKGTDGRAKG